MSRDGSRGDALATGMREPAVTALFLVSALAFCALGVVIYHIAPDPRLNPSDVAGLLLGWQGALKPEPAERYTYVFLTVVTPFVLHYLVAIAKRFPILVKPNAWLTLPVIATATFLAVPKDHDRGALLINGIEMLGWVGAVVAIALIVLLMLFPFKITRRTISIALCVVAVSLAAVWRLCSVGTLNDTGSGHFDAFFYSIVQIYYGGTCLVDVLPQYGCYGEILAPLLHVFGLSVLKISVVMLVMQAIALCAMIIFAQNMIRSSLVFITTGAWLFVVQNRVLWPTVTPGPYFQYWPLRTFFPALSLLLIQSWQAKRTFAKATLMGVFAGLSICWNLDSGVVVLLAMLGFVLFSGATASRFLGDGLWLRNIAFAAFFLVGAALAGVAFVGWLSLKSGQPINLARYLTYQQTFYILGFEMVPMPGLPDMWIVALGLTLVAFLKVAIRVGIGPYAIRAERGVFLAVLALGLFSYFNGRSEPLVFLHVSWPFVLLLGYLADSCMLNVTSSGGRMTKAVVRSFAVLLLLPAIGDVVAAGPQMLQMGVSQARDLFWPDQENPIRRQVAFIKSVTPPGDGLAILAYNQATLIAGAGRKSEIQGPGLFETLRKQDAAEQISELVMRGPKHLFIGKQLLTEQFQTWGSVPWVSQNLPLIERAYQVDRQNMNEDLLHFVRRP